MNERIKKVRTYSKLTQTEFANKIGLTKNFISLVENGNRDVSDRTIKDICSTFGCNEVWLRTGVGEPFAPKTREEEIAAFTASLLSNGSPEAKAFIAVLARTTPNEWELFAKKLRELAEEVENCQKEKTDL